MVSECEKPVKARKTFSTVKMSHTNSKLSENATPKYAEVKDFGDFHPGDSEKWVPRAKNQK